MFIYYELITIMYKKQSTIFGLIFTASKDANRAIAIFQE
jgi:hypothetical protein